MREFWNKIALAVLNALIRCQLTLLFSFIAWLGATSVWWGLVPIIVADWVLGDAFFERHAPIINVVTYVPRHLFYAVRRTSELLEQHEYHDRVAVVELFKSVCLSSIILIAPFHALYTAMSLKTWHIGGVKRIGCETIYEYIESRKLKFCAGLFIFIPFLYFCVFILFFLVTVTIHTTGRNLQAFHVTNSPMVTMALMAPGVLYFIFVCRGGLITARERCRRTTLIKREGEEEHA